MSDYKIVNGKKVSACKYGCNTMVAWDDAKKFFVEVDNNETRHTQERCKSMKENQADTKATDTAKTVFSQSDINVLEHVLAK